MNHTDHRETTVLVVDDEKTLRDTLEYNLRREGYKVLTAADGNEAIRLAYAERPDLIILDIMLPGMSGFDVCRAVRKELPRLAQERLQPHEIGAQHFRGRDQSRQLERALHIDDRRRDGGADRDEVQHFPP